MDEKIIGRYSDVSLKLLLQMIFIDRKTLCQRTKGYGFLIIRNDKIFAGNNRLRNRCLIFPQCGRYYACSNNICNDGAGGNIYFQRFIMIIIKPDQFFNPLYDLIIPGKLTSVRVIVKTKKLFIIELCRKSIKMNPYCMS